MKLLTRAEYDLLRNNLWPVCGAEDGSGPVRWYGEAEDEAAHALVTQGRAIAQPCRNHGCGNHLLATAAGREALRLWTLLVERGLVQP